MDVPVSLVEWEMFLPERYRVKRFEGDALPVPAPPAAGFVGGVIGGLPSPPVDTVVIPGSRIVAGDGASSVISAGAGTGGGIGAGAGIGGGAGSRGGAGPGRARKSARPSEVVAQAGQLMGRVVDVEGNVLPGATVRVLRDGVVVSEATSDGAGWFLMSGVPPGQLSVTALLDGYQSATHELRFDAANARRIDFQMSSGAVSESVAVRSLDEREQAFRSRADLPSAQAPSQNVFNLQRRVAGVLPVRIDVPRAGAAYRFVRPLVLDEPTRVSFEYRTK